MSHLQEHFDCEPEEIPEWLRSHGSCNTLREYALGVISHRQLGFELMFKGLNMQRQIREAFKQFNRACSYDDVKVAFLCSEEISPSDFVSILQPGE